MNLPDILRKNLRIKDSGLLSIKLDGESHLLKIYLENGEVVSLSLGTCKNEDCIKRLHTVVPLDHSFLKGAKSPATANVPLTQKIIEITGTNDSGSKAEGIPVNPGVTIKPQTIAAVEENVVEIIGPIGKMIVDKIFSKLSYSRGNTMSAEDYSYLLELLMKELPAEEQTSFIEKYRKG